MTIDYQSIYDQIGTIIQLSLPIGITMGIIERLVSFALDAMLDRIRRRERIWTLTTMPQ